MPTACNVPLQPAAYVLLIYNYSWLCELEIVDPPRQSHCLTRGQVAAAEGLWGSVRGKSRPAQSAPAAVASPGTPAGADDGDASPTDMLGPVRSAMTAYCLLTLNNSAYAGYVRGQHGELLLLRT